MKTVKLKNLEYLKNLDDDYYSKINKFYENFIIIKNRFIKLNENSMRETNKFRANIYPKLVKHEKITFMEYIDVSIFMDKDHPLFHLSIVNINMEERLALLYFIYQYTDNCNYKIFKGYSEKYFELILNISQSLNEYDRENFKLKLSNDKEFQLSSLSDHLELKNIFNDFELDIFKIFSVNCNINITSSFNIKDIDRSLYIYNNLIESININLVKKSLIIYRDLSYKSHSEIYLFELIFLNDLLDGDYKFLSNIFLASIFSNESIFLSTPIDKNYIKEYEKIICYAIKIISYSKSSDRINFIKSIKSYSHCKDSICPVIYKELIKYDGDNSEFLKEIINYTL